MQKVIKDVLDEFNWWKLFNIMVTGGNTTNVNTGEKIREIILKKWTDPFLSSTGTMYLIAFFA